MLTTETSAAAQAEHQRPGVLFGRKIENERKPSQDFHRALALPPAWQLTATGSGHVLPSKNGSANGILRADGFASSPSPHTTPSPSSPQKHEASHSSTPTATTWPKETLLSEAYPPGARTPLRRSPTPEHAPPQLPDPVALAVQFNLQQHGNRVRAAPGSGPSAPSPTLNNIHLPSMCPLRVLKLYKADLGIAILNRFVNKAHFTRDTQETQELKTQGIFFQPLVTLYNKLPPLDAATLLAITSDGIFTNYDL